MVRNAGAQAKDAAKTAPAAAGAEAKADTKPSTTTKQATPRDDRACGSVEALADSLRPTRPATDNCMGPGGEAPTAGLRGSAEPRPPDNASVCVLDLALSPSGST